MKPITITLLVALAVVQSPTFASSAVSPEEQEAIAAFIAKEGAEKSGEEDQEARKIIVEANPEARASIAALYTLEGVRGGTDWLQYVAVFTRSPTGLQSLDPIRVGGKGLRVVKFKAYEKGILELSTLNYSQSDALCCPSVPGVTHIIVGLNDRLEESEVRVDCRGKATNN